MANENLDRAARELYDRRYPHWPGCFEQMTFADVLRARAFGAPCPHCGKFTMQGLAPDVSPERAAEMLAELQARRRELGLEG